MVVMLNAVKHPPMSPLINRLDVETLFQELVNNWLISEIRPWADPFWVGMTNGLHIL